jgi:Tfp pilus assembly protein PilW
MYRQHLRLMRRSKQDGYSIAELLVATALLLTVLGAVFSFNRFQVFALQNQTQQQELQTMGRNLVELLTREIRRAGMDPQCVKSFEALASARYDQVRVKSDLNGDGLISGVNEDVTYRYNASTKAIERTSGGVVEPLTDSKVTVSSSMLTFFDGTGTKILPSDSNGWLGSSQRASVRRIRLALTLSVPSRDSHDSTPLRARFASNVELRNRFFTTDTSCP